MAALIAEDIVKKRFIDLCAYAQHYLLHFRKDLYRMRKQYDCLQQLYCELLYFWCFAIASLRIVFHHEYVEVCSSQDSFKNLYYFAYWIFPKIHVDIITLVNLFEKYGHISNNEVEYFICDEIVGYAKAFIIGHAFQ